MAYKFFDKKASGGAIKNGVMSNKELAEELPKSIIKKLEKRKVNSSIIDNIQGADLADMQFINQFNKGFKYLLCVIDIYSIGYSSEK